VPNALRVRSPMGFGARWLSGAARCRTSVCRGGRQETSHVQGHGLPSLEAVAAAAQSVPRAGLALQRTVQGGAMTEQDTALGDALLNHVEPDLLDRLMPALRDVLPAVHGEIQDLLRMAQGPFRPPPLPAVTLAELTRGVW